MGDTFPETISLPRLTRIVKNACRFLPNQNKISRVMTAANKKTKFQEKIL